MTEKEKVLKSLEICMFNSTYPNCCDECSYYKHEDCMEDLYKDIKKLVKGDVNEK